MTTNALETFPIVNQLDGRFAQAAPSRKPLATELESKRTSAQGFEGSCKEYLIRLASGYRYKLLFRASIARGEEHCRLICRAAFCISTKRGCASQPPTHSSAASLAAPGRPAAHPGTRSHPTVLQAGRNRSPWVRLPVGRSLGEEHEHARASSYSRAISYFLREFSRAYIESFLYCSRMILNVVNSPRSAYVFTLCEFSEFAFSCENSYAQTVRTFSPRASPGT